MAKYRRNFRGNYSVNSKGLEVRIDEVSRERERTSLQDLCFLPPNRQQSMKSNKSSSAIATAASLAICFMSPQAALAFSVTEAHGRSTYLAVHEWAAQVGYSVSWQPLTHAGTVDFPAPPLDVHEDFWMAVKALISGAAYGRANVYCLPPLEFQAEAIIDDHMRLVYVVGHPTGRRCSVPYSPARANTDTLRMGSRV